MMKTENIQISKLENNTGQVEGLPKNPRQIKDERYKKLVKSIKDLPEMLELRELLVYPLGKKYVVIGGNMRLRALKELKYTEAPCKVLSASTSAETLKQIAIKDNVGFGEDDWGLLGEEWSQSDLEKWGMDIDVENDKTTIELGKPKGFLIKFSSEKQCSQVKE